LAGSTENSGNTIEVPLFPLSTIVLPGGRLPLRIFEPRYLEMIHDCMRLAQQFGVCLVKRGSEVGGNAQIYPYGTLVKVIDFDQGEDRLLKILTEGVSKFRVVSTRLLENQLMMGEISPLPAEPLTPVPEGLQHLSELLRGTLESVATMLSYNEPDYDCASWVGGRLTELLPITPDVRNDLLVMDDPVQRLHELDKYFSQKTRG